MKIRLDRPVFRYCWTGGARAGYILLDATDVEICRVWSEKSAQKILKKRKMRIPQGILVDFVLKRLFAKK